jgi:hypothetical protein
MSDPTQSNMNGGRYSSACLEPCNRNGKREEQHETNPMPKGSSRKLLNWVSLDFAGEFIAIQRYDEEFLHIFSDGLPVVSPKRRHGIQQECQCVHAEFPDLLILILVTFFQSHDV